MTPDGWARIQDALQSPAAPAFVSQLTSDAVIEQFVTTEMTALAAPVVPTGGNSLYQSAAQMNAAVTKYVGPCRTRCPARPEAVCFPISPIS